jgi:transposase-like protein
VSMTNAADRVEIITSFRRRRRWTASEKVRMVEETFEPGMTVSLVARRHGVAPNQLFTWRRLVLSRPGPPATNLPVVAQPPDPPKLR